MANTLLQTRQLADNIITNSKLSDVAVNTIKGRVSSGTGDPQDLTVSQVKSMLGISGVSDSTLATKADIENIGQNVLVGSIRFWDVGADTESSVLINNGITFGFPDLLRKSNLVISEYHAWVDDALGNDSTGQLGNILKPFQTLNAAAAAGANHFNVGQGTYTYNELPFPGGTINGYYFFRGVTTGNTIINIVVPSIVKLNEWNDYNGTSGEEYTLDLYISSDKSCKVNLEFYGQSGAAGGTPEDPGDGGPGGNGAGFSGTLRLNSITGNLAIAVGEGGAGGAGNAGSDGPAGSSGTLSLTTYAVDSEITSSSPALETIINHLSLVNGYMGDITQRITASEILLRDNDAPSETRSLKTNSEGALTFGSLVVATSNDITSLENAIDDKADLLSETQQVQMLALKLWDGVNSAHATVEANNGTISFLNHVGDPFGATVGLTDLARVSSLSSKADLTDSFQNVSMGRLSLYDGINGNYAYVEADDTGFRFIDVYGDPSGGNTVGLTDLARLASPAFTGNPTAPTQTAGNNSTRIATTAFVSTAVANLVASAPGTLDTLNELATALGNDPNFATTISTSLGNKANISSETQFVEMLELRLFDTAEGQHGSITMTDSSMSFLNALGNPTTDTYGLTDLARLFSPSFSGNPTAPTQSPGNNTTRLATTAFVTNAVSGKADLNSTTQEVQVKELKIYDTGELGFGTIKLENNVISFLTFEGDEMPTTYGLKDLSRVGHTHAGTDITSGTINDARLSSNVALENVSNLFRVPQTISGGGLSTSTAIQIKLDYDINSGGGYSQIICTRHNAGTSISNAIDFYTSDGSSSPAFLSNYLHGLTVSNGRIGVGGVITPSEAIDVAGVIKATSSNATGTFVVSTTSSSSSIAVGTLLAPNATGDSYFAIGRSLSSTASALVGHSTVGGGNYACLTTYGRPASDLAVYSTGRVLLGAGLVQIGESGPLIKNASGTIQLKNAADTAFASLSCNLLELQTTGGYIYVGGRSGIEFNATNNIQVWGSGGPNTGFGILQLGGSSSSYPGIKRDGAGIAFRLADDSANANITSGTINRVTITAPATSATLTIANGATLTASANATVSGTNTGDNAVNSLYSGLVSNATHTGDVTGSTALTLATVNSNVGTFGNSTTVPIVTVNAKGLVTAVSTATISGGGGGITKTINVFTSSGTWTKPSNAKLVSVEILTPGQSGYSGGRYKDGTPTANQYDGGNGGVPGSILRMVNLDASTLGSTETVTIGASSTPGAARTTTGNPNAPTNPGNSSFGVYRALFNTELGAQLAGSLYAADKSGNGSSGVNSIAGLGGIGGTSSAGPGNSPVTNLRFASSGGGGGGATTTSGSTNGGAGGVIQTACGADATGAFLNERFLNSNAAGGTTTGTRNGSNGTQVAGMYIGYGGGGGASNVGGNAGNGGNGGGYGSGGGGGGACYGSGSFSSGAGGQGGPGIVVVITESWS